MRRTCHCEEYRRGGTTKQSIFNKQKKTLKRLGLLRFVRALKGDGVILKKCPWGAMTTYKGINYFMNFWEMKLESNLMC